MQVTFYKPQGNLNEHAGYATIIAGDAHIAALVDHTERSPQWSHMLVIITWDENGGWWDSVAPPKADRWGPGSRVPAIIVSPYAKRGFVDSTQIRHVFHPALHNKAIRPADAAGLEETRCGHGSSRQRNDRRSGQRHNSATARGYATAPTDADPSSFERTSDHRTSAVISANANWRSTAMRQSRAAS